MWGVCSHALSITVLRLLPHSLIQCERQLLGPTRARARASQLYVTRGAVSMAPKYRSHAYAWMNTRRRAGKAAGSVCDTTEAHMHRGAGTRAARSGGGMPHAVHAYMHACTRTALHSPVPPTSRDDGQCWGVRQARRCGGGGQSGERMEAEMRFVKRVMYKQMI